MESMMETMSLAQSYSSILTKQKWNEALEQCRASLNEADRETVNSFESPEALVEDLNRKTQLQAGSSPISRTLTGLKSQLQTVKKVSHLLILAMRPSSIEFGLLWGLLYLAIDLSLDTDATWKEMSRTLTRMTRTLQRCAVCSDFVHNDEFKDNLLAIFIAMIRFWASASRWMRENPFSKATEYLSKSFQATMMEMEDAANTMERCYSSRLAGRGQTVLSTNAIYTPRTNSIATEPIITYPHRQLPHDNVEKFIGRTDVLKQMHIYLKPSGTQETQHFAIWGLGGVGKSQCALAYANLYQDNYDATFWVRAESEPALNQSFINIAMNLGLVSPSTGVSPSEARDMVLVWLRSCGCRWLMIFDNVEKIDLALESMPTSPGSILVTTRYPNVADSARVSPQRVIQLKALDEEEAWSMFSNMLLGQHKLWKSESSLPDTEITSARRLLEKLGGLPLGIRQMAALIRKKKLAVEVFLKWYQKEAGNSKKIKGGRDFRVDPDYPYAVETVWALSFDALEKSRLEESSEAYILLAALSFLSPDAIPVKLFKQQCDMVDFCGDEDLIMLEGPKEELVDLALIDKEGDNISIHRLVQTTCLHHIPPDMLQKAFELACYLLNAAFPKQLFGRPLIPEWPSCLLYATHVQNITTRFEELQTRLTITDEFLEVLCNCAWYLHEIGDWSDSSKMVQVAKLACPKENSRVFSHLENTLGCGLFEANNLEKCRESLESALNIRRTIMEEGDEDLLCTINNYANLESGSGHPEKALKLYDEVQSIREGMGKETQVSLALTYGGTGQALVQLGRYVEAEEFYNKAYAIIVNEYGPEGHYVGHLHYVYGNLKLAQGNMNEALKDYRRGLEIYQASQPNHMLTACLLFKIGCIDIKQGRDDDARRRLQEAKNISQFNRSEENLARIARKLWPLIKDDSDATLAKESENLRVMASIWERKLLASGSDMSSEASADKAFNDLLCLFFR